jgi:hypothetical protein
MRLVGWLLAFVLALGASGFLLIGHSDARAQSAAIDSGTADTVTARLETRLEDHLDRRVGKSDRNGPDEWLARCDSDDPRFDLGDGPDFDVPGRGEILHEWDGKTVTCFVWTDGTVIAVKGPDGALIKSETVGWRGQASRWTSGVFALGVALLIGGTRLRMTVWTGAVGAVLVAASLFVVLHLAWPWVGVGADVVVVLALVWLVVRRRRGAKT